MPVNNFEFEKADGIISSIKGQSVGRDPISAAGIFNFVSIAQKGFGYEPEEEDMLGILYRDRDSNLTVAGLSFEKALSMCKNDEVFLLVGYLSFNWYTTSGFATGPLNLLDYEYSNDHPDRIVIYLATGTGYYWTAEGFEFFD